MKSIFDIKNLHFIEGTTKQFKKSSIKGTLSLCCEITKNKFHPELGLEKYFDPNGLNFFNSQKLDSSSLLKDVLHLTDLLLVKNNYLCERSYVIEQTLNNGIEFQSSCTSRESFIAALKVACEIINNCVIKGNSISHINEIIKKDISIIKMNAPHGFNTYHLLDTACFLDLPWFKFYGNIYQLGYGNKSHLFNSSESDQTSAISSAILKNKYATQSILKRNNFPIMPYRIVTSVKDGIKAASLIGFPVVVKPVDTEGGVGITAGIMNINTLDVAIKKSLKFSKEVIIEKYFLGNDYRIQVVDGEVQGVIARTAPYVIGDGKSNIIELIKKINYERINAEDDRKYLHKIKIDSETKRTLIDQGYNLDYVPKKEEKVKLSYTSNIAVGGEPKQIEIPDIHQDNINLCVNACKLFRIDIAGVDLLIPDIKVSWKTSGAHICEINHKPQMFTTLFEPMLRKKFDKEMGKIPIFIILSENHGEEFSNLVRLIRDKYADVDIIYAGNNSSNFFEIVRCSLSNPKTSALIVVLDDNIPSRNGLPFEYCDYFFYEKDNPKLKVVKDDFMSILKPELSYQISNFKKSEFEDVLKYRY